MHKPSFQMSADTKIVRSVLQECEIGDTVSYETLNKALGRDVREFAMGSLATARRSLLREERIVFACVPKVGYTRLDNSGIVHSMERDRRHLSRASGNALRKLECVAYDELKDEDKVSHTVAAAQFGVLRMFAKPSTAKRIEANVNNRKELAIGETLKLFA